MKKLILIIVAFLLTIQIAYAVPIFSEFDANPKTATSYTIFDVRVTDSDNIGIDWIKLYKDGFFLKKYNCNGETSCSPFNPRWIDTDTGTHTYYATARNLAGSTKQSLTVVVDFLPPIYIAWNNPTLDLGSGLSPLSNSEDLVAIGANTNIQVACTGDCTEITDDWVDGSNLDSTSQPVTFTCSSTTTGSYSATFDVTSNEDSSIDSITVSCQITTPANNQPTFDNGPYSGSIQVNTPFTWDVDASDLDLGDTLTFSDDASQFDIDINTGLISFTPTVIETINAIITVCDDSLQPNACNTQPFTLDVTAIPPISIDWDLISLDLGSGVQGSGVLSNLANIISTNINNNVYVNCISGDCPLIIYDNWVDGTNMIDLETQPVTFTCSDTTAGSFSANFDVTSDEDPTGDQIAVTCQITALLVCTDSDGDGYGVCPNCGTSQGCTYDGNDCDDSDSNTYPGATELPDGEDNDCDGSIDEGFDCIHGRTRSCGITNVGVCEYGIQTCNSGNWGSCLGAVNPVMEFCEDGLDNDCDGYIDEECYPPYIYTINLRRGDPVTINLAADEAIKINFPDGSAQYLTEKAFSPYYSMSDIYPDQTIVMKPDDPKLLDLDEDNINDLSIEYNGIGNNKASLTFSIPEIVSRTSSSSSKKSSSLPGISFIDYFKDEVLTPARVQTFRLYKKAEDQSPLAAGVLIMLLMLVVIVHFVKRKWNL